MPLLQEVAQPFPHICVNLVELDGGVSGAEVVAPASQDGIQLRDEHADILPPVAVAAGLGPNLLAYPLHASCRRPTVQVIAAYAAFQQPTGHSGTKVAAKK